VNKANSSVGFGLAPPWSQTWLEMQSFLLQMLISVQPTSVLETPSVHVQDTISPQVIDFDLDFTFGNISLSLNCGC